MSCWKEKNLFIYIWIDRLVIKHWKSYEAVLLCHKLPHLVVMGAGWHATQPSRQKTYAPMVTGWLWLDVASPLPQWPGRRSRRQSGQIEKNEMSRFLTETIPTSAACLLSPFWSTTQPIAILASSPKLWSAASPPGPCRLPWTFPPITHTSKMTNTLRITPKIWQVCYYYIL